MTSQGLPHPARAAGIAGAAAAFCLAACTSAAPTPADPARTADSLPARSDTPASADSYAGLWVTADGRIRQELLPNGRYTEARGNVQDAYTGSYRIDGTMIYYDDDSGFSADGEFRDGILYHAGMVMYRTPSTGS